ncbi:hypothetical protein ITP53_11195 [Nonomuraea sp. K274]|uniref:Uncharacterized protein n=1 Tax=Nonomuraea cypriaca TaxID=1187855 RepID=A0A931A949_9ACTN|nr:hypothetical protein [Nonomuraea cypriaca]MBF8186303.1 hypothetical protein [Nonomuraea cypriaca]
MDITTLHAVRRFPLLGRPLPACPSPQDRIKEITESAAEHPGTDGMHQAAHALNKAALLAGDCGLADLAHDLCWQHINIYRQAGPRLTVLQARYMIEPVLNLARLHIRADNGDQALRLLDALYQAVTAHADLIVEGHTLPLADLVGTRQEHHKLREWVWLQYLADGVRALAMVGRWDEAVTHARVHSGIGTHLMEGRQAEIIAHCLHGARQTARIILQECELTEPWERQVAACLNVMCSNTNGTSDSRDVTAMVGQFLGSTPVPGYAVYRARLGLTVTTLAGATDPIVADRLLARTMAETIASGDGYAARDVLGSAISLTSRPRKALARLVTSAGLGAAVLAEPLLGSLTTSAELATEALARSMLGAAQRT